MLTEILLLLGGIGAADCMAERKREKKKTTKRAEDYRPLTEKELKQIERERKAAARIAQARRDIKTEEETISDLCLLLDAAQNRYESATKDKDTSAALRQIVALRRQIAAAENRLEKANNILKYGG